jgi:hypothetical protein
VKPARYRARASVADGRDPPVSSSFPQSPPLLWPIPTAGAISAKLRHDRPAKAASCRPSLPLVAGRQLRAVPSPHLCCAITVPLLHCAVDARSRCQREELDNEASTAHPADGAGAAAALSSRPRRSPAGVRAWPIRRGTLVPLLTLRGHRSAHPFLAWLGQRRTNKILSALSPRKSPTDVCLVARPRPSTAER